MILDPEYNTYLYFSLSLLFKRELGGEKSPLFKSVKFYTHVYIYL